MYFSEKSLKSRPIHFNTKFDSPQNGSSNLRIPEEKKTRKALWRDRDFPASQSEIGKPLINLPPKK